MAVFDEYLADLPADQHAALLARVEHVRSIVPEATEGRSYGLPAFRYRDRPLIGFAAHAHHLGVYPFSPAVLDGLADQLEGYERSKGSVRFAADRPLPDEVLTELVRRRMREIDGGRAAGTAPV